MISTALRYFSWFAFGICTGMQMAQPTMNPLGLITAGFGAVLMTIGAAIVKTPLE